MIQNKLTMKKIILTLFTFATFSLAVLTTSCGGGRRGAEARAEMARNRPKAIEFWNRSNQNVYIVTDFRYTEEEIKKFGIFEHLKDLNHIDTMFLTACYSMISRNRHPANVRRLLPIRWADDTPFPKNFSITILDSTRTVVLGKLDFDALIELSGYRDVIPLGQTEWSLRIEDIIGVMINGVRWATSNVDVPGTFAEHPESFGMLFQWNRKKGWDTTTDEWDSAMPEGDTWEYKNDPCPPGWRVPTADELRSLSLQLSHRGSLIGVRGLGIRGHFFGIDVPFQLFLPSAEGFVRHVNEGRIDFTNQGHYWSSTKVDMQKAEALWCVGGDVSIVYACRREGFFVRCVAE